MKRVNELREYPRIISVIFFCVAAAILFATCGPLGGDVEAWLTKAKKANGIVTVTFNADGGTPAPAEQNIAVDGKVTEPPAMTKTGFDFGGWYKEAAFTNRWNFNTNTVTDNITLYAKWVAPFTVTFNANGSGGSGTEANPFSLAANTLINGSITSSDSAVWYSFNVTRGTTYYVWWNDRYQGDGTKTAYIFVSAFYSSGSSIFTDATSAWSNPKSFTVNTSGTVIIRVTAILSSSTGTFAVGYNTSSIRPTASGETVVFGTIAVRTVQAGGSITIPDDSGLSKTGYTFGGWNTAANGTGTTYRSGDSYTPTSDITLYARWIVDYTVTFESNDGIPAPAPQEIAAGGKVMEPPAMTKEGYGFDGWYKEAAFTNRWNFNTDTVTANTILYAKWNWDENFLESVTGLANKLAWLQTNAQSNGAYILGVDADEFIGPRTLYYYSGNAGTEAAPFQLPANTLVDGSITSSTSGSAVWYSFNVTSGTTYYVWLNDSQGQNKTLDAYISAFYSSGTSIFSNVDSAWSSPRSFTANTTGAVKIRVTPYSSGGTGTFAVAYNTNSTRPSVSGTVIPGNVLTNITVTLRGIGSNRNIYLSSNGSLFTVSSGVTLVLDNNITLQGRIANTDSLVTVNSGGSLRMNNGSAVTGNTVTSANGYGGGVYVNGGTFTMSGGTVSGNTSSSSGGGGVYVASGTFTMSSGAVSGNTANRGGGVYMAGGTFTMSDGTVSGNTVTSGANGYGYGGGVHVGSGTFTMSGGTVSGNTVTSGTNGYSYGGGVYAGGGTFTMSGGTVSGNTVTTTSSSAGNLYGGGVYAGNGAFNKTGGTVYGYSADDTVNSNAVKNNSGAAQSSRGHAAYATANSVTKRREATAGEGVNLWWNYNNNSPVFSGDWED